MTFGIPDERPIVEETLNSAPTAGNNDDGNDWERKDNPQEQGIDNWELKTPIVYQREIRRLWQIPEDERGEWVDSRNDGWYHRKGKDG